MARIGKGEGIGQKRRVAFFGLLLVLATRLPPAASAASSASELVFHRLTTENGLSSSFVNALVEDERGYIWIGTNDGLNRYDGYECRVYRFHPEDPAGMAGSYVQGLQQGPRGMLVVCPGIGGVDLYDPGDERFRHLRFGQRSPGKQPFVESTVWDRKERLWVATQEGLYVLPSPVDSTLLEVPAPAPARAIVAANDGSIWCAAGDVLLHLEPAAVDAALAHALSRSSGSISERGETVFERTITALTHDSGCTWAGTLDGSVLRLRSGEESAHGWEELPQARSSISPSPQPGAVFGIAGDGRGGAWIVRDPGRLDWVDPAGVMHPVEIGALGADGISDLEPDPGSPSVFVATRHGLAQVSLSTSGALRSLDTFRFDARDDKSLGANVVTSVLRDRRGGVWAGTRGGGVSHHDPYRVRFRAARWPPAQLGDPSIAAVESVLEDRKGRLWLGTAGGLVAAATLEVHGVTPDAAQFRGGRVREIFEDRSGTLWLGTDAGLARVVELGSEIYFVFALGGPAEPIQVNDIAEAPSGELWLATHGGLAIFQPRRGAAQWFVPKADDPRSIPSPACVSLAFDARGDLWIGTLVGGLSRYLGSGAFENYTPQPGQAGRLNNLSVQCLHPSRDGRFLWIGTYSGGLNRLDLDTRRFEAWTERDGLPGDKINAIVEDARGRLWLTTNRGIARFDVAAGKITCYDAGDGLPGNEFAPRAAASRGDGRLVLAGTNGYTVFDPEAIRSDPIAPPIVLTAFRTFDRVVPVGRVLDGQGRISLSHREDFVSFEFAALDYSAPPRARYSYKLEGLDREWIEGGPRRFASYPDLDPGSYVFRVRAANRDGVADAAGLAVSLVVRPPFWRTPWFGSLSLLALGAVLFGFHRRDVHARVRRSLAEERIRALERERVRGEVARDYHDEVGVQLTRISLYTELVRRELEGDASPETRAFLGKIADAAQVLTRRTREFLWTLDLRQNRVADLLAYLEESGRALFEESDTRFEVQHADRDTTEEELGPERKRHLALLFREALHNARKHARARTVVVSAQRVGEEIRVEVADDGIGFDLERAQTGSTGQGLANLRTRAREAGGRIVIETRAGLGTRVRFEGPREPKSPESGTAPAPALERTIS